MIKSLIEKEKIFKEKKKNRLTKIMTHLTNNNKFSNKKFHWKKMQHVKCQMHIEI